MEVIVCVVDGSVVSLTVDSVIGLYSVWVGVFIVVRWRLRVKYLVVVSGFVVEYSVVESGFVVKYLVVVSGFVMLLRPVVVPVGVDEKVDSVAVDVEIFNVELFVVVSSVVVVSVGVTVLGEEASVGFLLVSVDGSVVVVSSVDCDIV